MTGGWTAVDGAVARGPLGRFPRECVEQWLSAGVRVETPPGSFIYHEHDEPRAGVVVEGLLRMFMSAPDGRQVTVRYARAGQLIGIPAVVGGPAPVSVQMLTRTVVVMIPVGMLEEAGRTNAAVAWLFAEETCRRLYDTLEGLAGNAFGTLTERVCRHLLDLAAHEQNGDRLVVAATQQELANAVGSTRAAVARVLNDLRRAGFLGRCAEGIELRDPLGVHEAAWARE